MRDVTSEPVWLTVSFSIIICRDSVFLRFPRLLGWYISTRSSFQSLKKNYTRKNETYVSPHVMEKTLLFILVILSECGEKERKTKGMPGFKISLLNPWLASLPSFAARARLACSTFGTGARGAEKLCQNYCPPTRYSFPSSWDRPIRQELEVRGVSPWVAKTVGRPTAYVLICIARNFDGANQCERRRVLEAERMFLQDHSPIALREMERFLSSRPGHYDTSFWSAKIRQEIWGHVGGAVCDCCATSR